MYSEISSASLKYLAAWQGRDAGVKCGSRAVRHSRIVSAFVAAIFLLLSASLED
jgi:tetrahydromethanopterin S-methyltransferase subunit F